MDELLRWLASWRGIEVEPGSELQFELANFPTGGLGMLVLMGCALAVVAVAFLYRRDGKQLSGVQRFVLGALRTIAVLAVVLLLLEPNLVTVKRETRAGHCEYFATATVLLSAAAEAHSFRLPATALGSIEANRPAVWRIRDAGKGTTVEAVPVEVLRYLDGEVLISGPLSEQDRLVSAGVHRLAAGMAVQAIPRSDKAAL